MLDTEKRIYKVALKKRMVRLLVSIPFGIVIAALFWYINLSPGLQLFLTIICWGVVIGLIELIVWGFSRIIKRKEAKKPKKKDPFAD